MDLTWWLVAIVGLLALAVCVALALFRPVRATPRALRPLANVGRLTTLPEYVRAARLRTVATIVTIALLGVTFVAAVVTAARPTGLPSTARQAVAGEPEDVMLCVAPPATGPAASAVLSYFAAHVTSFDTQRIGLTSSNRRVVPLTRDYQYAAARFGFYAAGAQGLVSPVSYVDYTESVEDLMALCLTGFPAFDQAAGQRRSVIYVGPDALRSVDDPRPTLYRLDRVEQLARAGGVQVNVIATGSDSGALTELARDTGGQAFSANGDVAAQLAQIRDRPPAAAPSADALAKTTDSPDIPLILALLAATLLAGWPLVTRR